MSHFRTLLIALTAIMILMTIAAVATEGLNLITPYLSPILALTWQGQFNVDFACYLVLSGVWMAWRGGFTSSSITLGVLAPVLGMLFFAPYLIYQIGRAEGDPKKLLLGVHAEPAQG